MDYNEVEGRAAVAQIEAAGGQAHFYATDVRLEESVAAAVAQIGERDRSPRCGGFLGWGFDGGVKDD